MGVERVCFGFVYVMGNVREDALGIWFWMRRFSVNTYKLTKILVEYYTKLLFCCP